LHVEHFFEAMNRIEMMNRALLLALLAVLGFHAQAAAIQGDPNLAEQERQKLYEAAQAIPDAYNVGRDLAKDLEALSLIAPLLEHAADLEKKYAEGIASENQPYRNLKGNIEYSRNRIAEFEKAIRNWANLESIRADAEHARKMMTMSIENQAPAYYREENDIAIKGRSIASRIQVLEQLALELHEHVERVLVGVGPDGLGLGLRRAHDLGCAQLGVFGQHVALDQLVALFFGERHGSLRLLVRLSQDLVALIDDLLRLFDLVGDRHTHLVDQLQDAVFIHQELAGQGQGPAIVEDFLQAVDQVQDVHSCLQGKGP